MFVGEEAAERKVAGRALKGESAVAGHLTPSPSTYSLSPITYSLSKVAALVDDLADGVPLVHPGEDVHLGPFDPLGAQKHLVGDLAGDADDAVDVAHDDVARAHCHLADPHGHLVVRYHAAAKRSVRDAVLVENREVLLEYLLGVADAAGDHRAADALGDGGGGHDAAPETGLHVVGSVPHHDAVRLEVVQHLRAERHLALDHHVGGALHRERLTANDHLVAERHDLVREVLVEKAGLAHHVVHASRVELLEPFAELLHRNRELVRGDGLALRDKLVQLHQTGLLGLGPHVC